MIKNGNYFYVARQILSNLYAEKKDLKPKSWGRWRRERSDKKAHIKRLQTRWMFSVETKWQQSEVNCHTTSYVPFVEVYNDSIHRKVCSNVCIPFVNCHMHTTAYTLNTNGVRLMVGKWKMNWVRDRDILPDCIAVLGWHGREMSVFDHKEWLYPVWNLDILTIRVNKNRKSWLQVSRQRLSVHLPICKVSSC